MRSWTGPTIVLAALLGTAPAQAQELESVAVQYLRPPSIALGAVEVAVSVVGAGFHLDAAHTLAGVTELSTTRTLHLASGVLALSRVAAVAPSIGALVGATSMRDIFWAFGPSYIAVGTLDLIGAAVAIDSAVRLGGVSGSTPAINDHIARSRTINQGWGVSVAILAGVELVLGIATTAQAIDAPRPVAVWVVPTPGGFAIGGRFGGPPAQWRD